MSQEPAKPSPVATFVTDQLSEDLAGKVPREEIEEVVIAKSEEFADARVTSFVPTLLARQARDELESLAGEKADVPPEGWQDEDTDSPA